MTTVNIGGAPTRGRIGASQIVVATRGFGANLVRPLLTMAGTEMSLVDYCWHPTLAYDNVSWLFVHACVHMWHSVRSTIIVWAVSRPRLEGEDAAKIQIFLISVRVIEAYFVIFFPQSTACWFEYQEKEEEEEVLDHVTMATVSATQFPCSTCLTSGKSFTLMLKNCDFPCAAHSFGGFLPLQMKNSTVCVPHNVPRIFPFMLEEF